MAFFFTFVPVWISLKSHIFFSISIKNISKNSYKQSCQWIYMNSFPNLNQISISIKDIAFYASQIFIVILVQTQHISRKVLWCFTTFWFIDLYFILFSSICIRHTLKLDFNILFWWYFEICTFIWFSRIVFFLCRNLGGKSKQFAITIDCLINVPIWNFQDNWTRVINSDNYQIFIQDSTFYSILTYT